MRSILVFSLAFSAISFASSAVAQQMLTRWGKDVTATNVWREHPRPGLVREGWVNLNGDWQYAVTKTTG